MGRPRKVPPAPSADPDTLVADVLDEVKTVLKENGIAIPLPVWIEAQQAAAALLNKANNPNLTNPATPNGVPSHD
jgi:xanthine dehydrogenase molybdopterin-binding subunit B